MVTTELAPYVEELEGGERVVRLRRRHIFHAECRMSAMVNHGAPL